MSITRPAAEDHATIFVVVDRASWDLDEGTAITPDRTVLKGIGGGAMYEVYLIWDQELFALAVAKLIRPDQVDDPRALREMQAEWDVLGAINHPVIVRGYDVSVEGRYPHLLIEHLEGPSLRRLIRRGGALGTQEVLPLALHVAGALAYLAGRQMVHLDVKPDNIVMGVPPRLIDLSIARSFERAAATRGPLGTDAYMAPEQCGPDLGTAPIGPAADVWGLGATLFHALAGERPFPRPEGARESADPAVRFPQLHASHADLPKHLPAALRDLVARMLRKDPGERPSAAGVADELEPLIAELPHKLSMSRRGSRL